MATLIAVYTSAGCVGRCDARCYTAKDHACDCICQGVNHGTGRQRATDNTVAMADRWATTYTRRHRLRGVRVDVPARTEQLRLDGF